MRCRRFRSRFYVLFGGLFLYICELQAQVSIQLEDQNGAPLVEAVVVVSPRFSIEYQPPASANIDQIDQQFVPRVQAVQVGAEVYFPNQDQIRHHVYSFSEAKQFDIPLYSGTPSEPIRFDQPGIVVLGCNIHDWMRGYLVVSESPFFGVTDATGQVNISLPTAGSYELAVWHPEQSGTFTAVTFDYSNSLQLSYQIKTAKSFLPRRSNSASGAY